jgi:hypothetical protein
MNYFRAKGSLKHCTFIILGFLSCVATCYDSRCPSGLFALLYWNLDLENSNKAACLSMLSTVRKKVPVLSEAPGTY